MKISFQADADLNEDIVSGALRREPGIDFQTAEEAGLAGLKDMSVLTIAAREGRVLVSHDRRTMPIYFSRFITTTESPGLFIASQKTDVRSVIEESVMIWASSEAEEWVNRVCTIPL